MNVKYLLIGIILTLLLINGTIGEKSDTGIKENQTVQQNETQKAQNLEAEELTLEQLMETRDWSKIAEMMNKENTLKTAPSSIESSIKPLASNEKWDNWFAPKQEEGGFIIIPCGG